MKRKTIQPRPYQAMAVVEGLKALRSAKKRALIVMATGLGKTITAALIAQAFGLRKKVLFLVHNNFILDHAMSEFRLVFGDQVKMAIYNGQSKTGAHDAQFVFATWQTMGEKLSDWQKDHFDLVIVDEAHHTEALTYAATARYFHAAKLGLTATPDRNDDEDIRCVFGSEVVNISLEQAIARGWLPKIEYHVVTDESLDDDTLQGILKEIKDAKRRYTKAEITKRLFIRKQAKEVSRIITSYCESALVFCKDIEHANKMAEIIPHARAFHSGQDEKCNTMKKVWDRNQKVLSDFRDGTISHVTAVNAFNEGVDVPKIGLVALLRQHGVVNTWRQQIGRGLRPGKGKNKLIVLDFVSNLERIQLLLETIQRVQDEEDKYVPGHNKRVRLLDENGDIAFFLDEEENTKPRSIEVSGTGFTFKFSQEIVDLMKVLAYCERDFYPTWEEASEAAIKLGIKIYGEYRKRYREDPALYSQPEILYPDFPGYPVFLGGKAKKFYGSWKEASAVAITKGITTQTDYFKRHSEDPVLPRNPHQVYSDFPGYPAFLGKKVNVFCKTWQEASTIAKGYGLTNRKQWDSSVKRKSDTRLPSNPNSHYKDYPGDTKFFGKVDVKEKRAKTWKQARSVVKKLKISGRGQYIKRYQEDQRLPSQPQIFYSDFPGWDIFLGKV